MITLNIYGHSDRKYSKQTSTYRTDSFCTDSYQWYRYTARHLCMLKFVYTHLCYGKMFDQFDFSLVLCENIGTSSLVDCVFIKPDCSLLYSCSRKSRQYLCIQFFLARRTYDLNVGLHNTRQRPHRTCHSQCDLCVTENSEFNEIKL